MTITLHPRIADWPAVASLSGLPRSVLSALAEHGTDGPDGRVIASVTAAARKRIARRLRVKPRQVGYAIRALRTDWFLVDGDGEDTVVIDYVSAPPATARRTVA